MGLDITGYPNARRSAVQDEDGPGVRVYINPDFPGRADEFEDGVDYDVDRGDDKAHIRMGYGRYNGFRDRLAQMAGYPKGEDTKLGLSPHCQACWNGASGPFSELINFSDCEGTIGTSVSAKLAEDFREFQDAADLVSDFPDFPERYRKLRRIFETASNGGFVIFS